MRRTLAMPVAGIALSVALVGPAGASDESTAKKLVITAADVGSGYSAAKSESDTSNFAKIAACVGKAVPKRTIVAHAAGPDLTSDDGTTLIRSNVDVVKTTAMARADRAVFANSKLPGCLEKITKRAGGGDITSVKATRAKTDERGDYSTAVVQQVEGVSEGKPASVAAVQVGIIKGRVEFAATFLRNGDVPFDRTTAEEILDKIQKRLEDADL